MKEWKKNKNDHKYRISNSSLLAKGERKTSKNRVIKRMNMIYKTVT